MAPMDTKKLHDAKNIETNNVEYFFNQSQCYVETENVTLI